MLRRISIIAFGALVVLAAWSAVPAEAANPCNPCAAKNPCAANPCAAKNPCAANPCAANPCAAKNPCGGNPCNPCGGGGASAQSEGRMITGQVTGYRKGYLGVRASDGRTVRVHVTKTTLASMGGRSVRPASLKRGTAVYVSTQARGNYYKANFIYAMAGGGGNPCGNPCGGNPCLAKNPCNPCGAKNPCNPCAKKR